jgi:Protein of unknown function (DUF3617)
MRDQFLTRRRLSCAQVLATGTMAAIFGAALAANALPGKKPGLWVSTKLIHIHMTGHPADTDNTPRVSAMCTDASTDAIEAKLLTGGLGKCGLSVEGSGNTYTISGTCPDPMGGADQLVTHGRIVSKSDTEIHMESQSTSPQMSSSVVADAKWVGACPAGVMPGDQGTFVNGVFKKSGNIKDALPKTR